jgi:hypothetical protein
MMRSILIKTVLFTALFALSECSSFEAALLSLLDDSKVPAVEDMDYSYPASGGVVAEGTIAFKFKPGFWEKLFHNPKPPAPINESEILVYMDLRKAVWFWPWLPEKRGGPYLLIFNGDSDQYTAKGDIVFGNARHRGKLIIWKYPVEKTNDNFRLIVLKSASIETVSVEMNNFIATGSTIYVVRSIPPYWWGDLVLRGKAYRIFAVIEEDYYTKYPDFSQKERGDARRGFPDSRVETTAHFFLKPERKFQITDNSRVVMAELRGDVYTLYDTLPQAEWDDMKQALALLHAFRYIASRLLY